MPRFIFLGWFAYFVFYVIVAGLVAAALTVAVAVIVVSFGAGVALWAIGRLLAALHWRPTWSAGLTGAGHVLMVTLPLSTVQLLRR